MRDLLPGSAGAAPCGSLGSRVTPRPGEASGSRDTVAAACPALGRGGRRSAGAGRCRDGRPAAERMFAFAAPTPVSPGRRSTATCPGGPYDRVWLLKHAAQAASLIGDGDEAVRLVERPCLSPPSPRPEPPSGPDSGRSTTSRGVAPGGALFREALALVPDGEESVLVARIYAGLGLLAAAWSRLDDADTRVRAAWRWRAEWAPVARRDGPQRHGRRGLGPRRRPRRRGPSA